MTCELLVPERRTCLNSQYCVLDGGSEPKSDLPPSNLSTAQATQRHRFYRVPPPPRPRAGVAIRQQRPPSEGGDRFRRGVSTHPCYFLIPLLGADSFASIRRE